MFGSTVPMQSQIRRQRIFFMLFVCFSCFLHNKTGLFAIHSASILYREKGMAFFPGHSGMGKSTHTGLWHQLLGTPFLNGDLNLLGIHENRIMVYGIPWCGTSGIYTIKTYELGGIVLLGRDPARDYLEELSPSGPNPPGNAKNDLPRPGKKVS